MFTKIVSPILPICSQIRCFSTVTPVVFKYVKNPRNPESRFVIRQVLPTEIDEVADGIAEVYFNRENVVRTLKVPREEFKQRIFDELKESQEQDLAIVCRDEKSNKIAGALVAQDLRPLIDSIGLSKDDASSDLWGQYEDFYKTCFIHVDQFAMPKGLVDVLYCRKIAVIKEFSQLTIGNNIMHVARFLHPKMTKFNRNIIIATHEYTYNFCKMNGFELIKKIPYKSIRDRNNKKPFEKMTKMDNRTEADECAYVLKREHQGQSYFQEIKKGK